jgi:predicted methyltransferase
MQKTLISFLTLMSAVLLASPALGAEADAVQAKLEAAMASDIRTAEEKARDANRKPIETLQFFGLEEDMRVLELVPGNGAWYTKLLAPVLADKGELYVAIGTDGVQALLDNGTLENVNVVQIGGELVRDDVERRIAIQGLDFPLNNLDMVLTFRNLHNFTEQGRRSLNEQSFKVLKSGGVYGVVDHTRRHMQDDDSENRRRMDPVQMIKEIEAVGFELVDYSKLHYRPDDELRYEVGRATVTGNTDRFTLLFRKP